MSKLTDLWIKVIKEEEIEEYPKEVNDLYDYTIQLKQERDKYKSIVEELKEFIKTEKEKNLQLGTSTNDLEYRAYSLAMQVKLCEIEDKITELEEGNSNDK